jgi:uncharacterized membrane protein
MTADDAPPGTDHRHGHGHGHGHDHELETGRLARRVLGAISIGVALVVALLVVVLWPPTHPRDLDDGSGVFLSSTQRDATVRDVVVGACDYDPSTQCQTVTFALRSGPDSGIDVVQVFPLVEGSIPRFEHGDRVVLDQYPDAQTGGRSYTYADRQRRSVLLYLAGLFAVVVLVLARWRGVAALVALVVSIVVLLRFVVPAILDGSDPVVVSLVGAACIAFFALYLTHGVNALTTVALLGTFASLLLTALLAWIFFEVGQFTGFVAEEVFYLQDLGLSIGVRGLLLGGVVIGAMGALDDVTVTQASAVAELRAADPTMSRMALYQAGVRIGRDHVASAVNTLVLAYAGASMPLLLVFTLSGQSLGTVANGEIVAIEIVRTLVGSIGLVAAVPLTTWLAALVAHGGPPAPAPVGGTEPIAGEAPAPPDRLELEQ